MAKGIRIPDDVRDEICEMARNKIGIVDISNETGVAVPTIYSILRTAEVALPQSQGETELTAEQQVELLDGYLNGEKSSDLRDRYNLTVAQFYKLLNAAGIQPGTRAAGKKSAREEAMDVAVALYANHEIPLWKITQETGINQPTLTAEIHKRQLPLRRPRRSADDAF
jgi:hypothetical protein